MSQERGMKFTFKIAMDVEPGGEFIICSRICANAH